MPLYRYKGRDKDRTLLEDTLEALNLEEAANSLTQQGITLINIFPASNTKASVQSLLQFRFGKASVKMPELIMFCTQMSSLTKAGISLVIAVKRLAEVSSNPAFRETLQGIERGVVTGQTLASCLRHYPAVFPSLFVELIELGEESGKLDDAFLQIGNYLAMEYETRKRFKAAVRYPVMVLGTIVAAMAIINIFVVPNFAKLYTGFHTELPLPTVIMIGFSNFLQHRWGILLSIILAVFFCVRAYLKTPGGRKTWDHRQFKIPIIGMTLERVVLSRFARTLAIVFNSGISLEKGLVLVAGAVDNSYAKERILGMRENIQNGENLSKAAADTQLFSPLVLQMISVGEETGAVDAMLQEIAVFYEREVDYDLESLGHKIEPVLLSVVAGMVLMLAIAVFLPMWDIYKFAQGSH